MRVAALVDRHAVHRGAQVGAVIEVEAAQVELIGLALAAMLADHQTRHRFQHFAGTVHGARRQFLLRDRAGAGGIGHASWLLREPSTRIFAGSGHRPALSPGPAAMRT
jgi:hypothetical protein